jgi:hypothetical protein
MQNKSESIADLCASLYGEPVWIARSLVSRGMAIYDDEDCSKAVPREKMTAIEEISWRISPNPAEDYLWIIGAKQGREIELIDMYGRMVMRKTLDDYQQLDISTLQAGMYIIRDIESATSQSFIKVK